MEQLTLADSVMVDKEVASSIVEPSENHQPGDQVVGSEQIVGTASDKDTNVQDCAEGTLEESKSQRCLGETAKMKKGEIVNSKSAKMSRKEQAKARNKDDRSVEHILKALQSLKTPEERLAALCKKHADLMEENRNTQVALQQGECQILQLMKEKDQLQTEHSKAILARSRMEGLCRELQKQCIAVKEESIQHVREEEEKRKEISKKFQATLTEVSSLMQDVNQKNVVLRDDNIELTQKLKTLLEQYELRKQHVDQVVKHKELESQLTEAKLAKANMIVAEEEEKHLREKQKLLVDLTESQRRCTELATNEVQLRNQLAMYTDKYTEFQDTLTKSNQAFVSFKGEMEKMSRTVKKLEKETGSWKARWESSNRALLEMVGDKQKRDNELANSQKKVTQLEKLCRALQMECTTLRNQQKCSGSNKESTGSITVVPTMNDSSPKDVSLVANGDDVLNGALCCGAAVDVLEAPASNSSPV